MAAPRALVVFAFLTLAVVSTFAVVAWVGEWWVLPIALAAHGLGFLAVMTYLAPRLRDEREKPDPVTQARVEEEEAERSRNGSGRSGEEERQVFH